jgi:hypothetical protein
MKPIREIQYEKARELYTRLIRFRGDEPTVDEVDKLSREIIYSTDRTPLCGKYRIKSHKKVDTNSLNVELGLVKTDLETVSVYLDEVQKRIRTSEFAAEVWGSYSDAMIRKASYNLATLASSSFLDNFTTEIPLTDYIDKSNTTMSVDNDGNIVLPIVVSNTSNYIYKKADIVIKPTVSGLTAAVIGTPTNILNIDESGDLNMSLSGGIITDAGFSIEIITSSDNVNLFSIALANVTNGIKIGVTITNDKMDKTKIYSSVITNTRIDVPFEMQNVRKIEIVLSMSNPNIVQHNMFKYEFVIRKISLTSDMRKYTAVYQTKEIVLNKGVSYISVVSEEEKIGNSILRYFISTSKKSDGTPDGFSYYDTSKSDRLLNVNISKGTYDITPDTGEIWSLSPIFEYGHRLFNILDIMDDESRSSHQISDNLLLPVGDNIINKESVKLYRGTGDYLITSTSTVLEKKVDYISTIPDINEITEWVNRVPLLISISSTVTEGQISTVSGGTRNCITIPYIVKSPDTVSLMKDNRHAVKPVISNIIYTESSTSITFSTVAGGEFLDPNSLYTITYSVKLEDYSSANSLDISIDTDYIDVVVDDEIFTYGIDYLLHNNHEIELLKSGRYVKYYNVDNSESPAINECLPVAISYTYTSESTEPIVYFETNVYCSVATDITVIPFTTSESAAGNAHIINGSSTGTLRTVTLNQGWNTIKSTHPHPSRNAYDLNSITGVPSSAGVILPDNAIIRPYRDSMRQVSPFTLMNMDPVEAKKCFSFVNGKILISFVPEFIDPNFINEETMSGEKGRTFICKSPVLASDYSNSTWTALPETFTVEFSYSDTFDKSIFIRAEAEIKDSTSSIKLLRLGINQYKGE